MPIDPRIALAGVSPTYDFMGAYNTSRAAAQTARANQMAMQAAEATATAQRNAMLEAQTLDPTNQAAMRAYALRNPAAAEQVFGGLASADNIFSARGTEARAQKGFETEQRDSLQGFMRNALASIRNNPSDENIAAVSAQAVGMGIPQAQMDAYAGRFRAVPVEQRGALLDNELATTEEGRALLKTFTRDITMDDVGGSLVPRDTNLLAVGAVMPTAITKTPDPTPKTQLVQLADGTFTVVNLGTGQGTTATLPGGAPAVGRVPGAAPAADVGRAAAATTLRDALSQLRTNFGTLYRRGFMRGEGVAPAGNVAQYVRDRVPFLRGVQLSGDAEAATASDSIDTLLSTAVSTLSSLYGTSSRVMDAVKEMENVRKSFGSETMTYEAAVNAVDTVMRRVDELEAEQGGGGAADPLEGRTAVGPGGQRLVRSGGQWVPQ